MNFSNFKHQKVNHSQGFVAPDGTHTNSIEGTWNGTKCTMSSWEKSQDRCSINILTFIWGRQNKGNLWKAILKHSLTIFFLSKDLSGASLKKTKCSFTISWAFIFILRMLILFKVVASLINLMFLFVSSFLISTMSFSSILSLSIFSFPGNWLFL